jgi:hypothetical protein
MRVTQKQVLFMYDVLMATCKVVGAFPFSQDDRVKMLNEIYNQQSDELIDLDEKESKK